MLLAHGVGVRSDLPLPVWMVVYASAVALAISFAALRILWTRPHLERLARGRPVPEVLGRAGAPLATVLGVVGVVVTAVVIVAGLTGPDDVGRNAAPVWIYVVFWVGLQIASAVGGPGWRWANPASAIVRSVERLTGRVPEPDRSGWVWTHWPAVAGVGVFLWLELAFHEPADVRVLGGVALAHLVIGVSGGLRLGSAWLDEVDPFVVLFGLLAAMAPLGRDLDGRLVLRWPFTGLADVVIRPGTMALVLVLLGSTTFDGLSRTVFWAEVVGDSTEWSATGLNTVGLVWVIGLVASAYVLATSLMARISGDGDMWSYGEAHLPALVPIALGYSVAHYFSLLVFEGQRAMALASDPLGRGWDLFGTAAWTVDFRAVSPTTIAWVQVAGIVVGHLVAVAVSHDRTVADHDVATASRVQYPMLGVMVGFTCTGLLLLLNA